MRHQMGLRDMFHGIGTKKYIYYFLYLFVYKKDDVVARISYEKRNTDGQKSADTIFFYYLTSNL